MTMKNWRVALGSLSSWSGWVITAILGLRLMVALISDPNRTQNFSPLWLVTWLAGVGAMAIWALICMALGLAKRLRTKPRPWANLLVIAIAGVIGNLVVFASAVALNLDNEPLWIIRIAGGAFASAIEFFLVNTLRASYVARKESIRKLVEIEGQLLGYQDSAKQIIQDEIERLRESTKSTLLPAIDKIHHLIQEKTNSTTELVDSLKDLIQNNVRPLSKEVLLEADTLSKVKPLSGNAQKPTVIWKKTFRVKLSLRPGVASIFFAMAFPMIEYMLIDHRSAFRGLIGGLATGVVIAVIKAFIPESYTVKTRNGIILSAVIATMSIVPSIWFMWQEYGLIREVVAASAFQLTIAILGSFLFSYTKALELNQEAYEQKLVQYTQELQKEVALFEQKLALEKRAWSRLIHGEVQAALTAAVTRLQMHDTLEPYQLEMVKQDLNRAKQNLICPPEDHTNFNQALAEIVFTWKSICHIEADISARAQRAIDINQDTRTVTNEIIKEAVSNAIRHGQAKNVKIKLDRIQDDILKIEIENDGFKAINPTPGLGSQMLDELTLHWDLENQNNKVTLKAEVPISKN